MKKVRLNGYFMTTRERAHRHLRRRLRLPDYYGNNLDALYDCLGDVGEPTEIVLKHAARLDRIPDDYGKRLVAVLVAASAVNPNLTVEVRPGR